MRLGFAYLGESLNAIRQVIVTFGGL